MRTALVLNGPNLNLLGRREPAVYGSATLDDVEDLCRAEGRRLGIDIEFRQSNSEGELIDAIHEAARLVSDGKWLGVVLNPGAYGHTSIGLYDAIKGTGVPVVECHISNVYSRESFRHHSFISPVARGIVVGFGVRGYVLALNGLYDLTHPGADGSG